MANVGTTSSRQRTLRERNLILLNAAIDIFGLTRGAEWKDVKRTIASDQIRELYKVVATLWPPNTDLSSLLPTPDSTLRALYLGDARPDVLARSVFRFGLYADEILIVNPFLNPWCVAREYNPLEDPGQYKADTLKLIAFIALLGPWIETGLVTLIPDPGDFDYALRKKTWELSRERHKNWRPSPEDQEEFEPVAFDAFSRFFFTLPKDYLARSLRKFEPGISDEQVEQMLAYIDKQRERDSLAVDQPVEELGGQLIIARTGANLEMALYIAQLTGAFPYTNIRHRWEELLSLKQELPETGRLWSPLTKAFQDLEFKFLNNVDPQFACSLRTDGRLESFRSFLRRLWKTVGGEPAPAKIASLSRDFKDELTAEYHKAEAEWAEIDRSLATWAGPSLGAAIISGGFHLEIPALGFCVPAVFKLLESRLRRREFKNKVPLSVFIDLSKRKSDPGRAGTGR